MKKGGGKAKGSQWERDFCKDLSLWWSDGKDKDIFWRTHSSGARKGISEESGDVMSVKSCGNPFTNKCIIELKCTSAKDMLLNIINLGSKSIIMKWWFKLQNEAKLLDRIPLLIIKFSSRNTLVFFKYSKYSSFGYKDFDYLPIYGHLLGLAIIPWEDFKNGVRPW